MTERPLALVTGASGFIAQHVTLALLDAGYRVRGTVRTKAKADETRAVLERAAPGASAHLTFVEAALEAEAGWAEAIQGVESVLHVASPIPLVQPKDRDALAAPARAGVLNVLRAAQSAGAVRKVVMTSSVAAVADGRRDAAGRVYTEADWSDPEGPKISPYARSKTIAERAAWAFMESERPNFSLSTVLPALVLGPVLSADYGVSPEVVRRLMSGEVPGTPRLGWSIVDVRDVASLHLLALKSDAASGQRFIASNGFMWMRDMADALMKGCPDAAGKVPKVSVPDLVLRVMGLLDPAVRSLIPDLGRKVEISNARAVQELGWRPRSAEEAAIATGRSLVQCGVV
jgi:dihydroflavonol-4-reductase